MSPANRARRRLFSGLLGAGWIAATPSAQAQTTPAPASTPAPPPSAPSSGPDASKNAPIHVVVTGTRLETDAINVPADVKVVRRDRLQRPGTKSAPAALNDVSGVKLNPRQENAAFTDFEVRGLTGNSTSGGNVLVMLDGIPQRRLSFGGPYMGALPFEAILREELMKGPSSSLYGRNALSGALQLFSDPGSEQLHFDMTGWYEYPMHDVRTGLRASGPLGKEPIGGTKMSTWSMTASHNYAEGWQPRTQAEKGDLYLHVNVNLSDRDKLTVLGGFYNGVEGYVAPVPVDREGKRMYGVSRNANLAVPGQNGLDLNEQRFAVRYTRTWSDAVLSKLTVSWWRGDSLWAVGRPDDRPATGTIMARSASDRHFLENVLFSEAEVQGRYQLGNVIAGALSAGASYEYLQYLMTSSELTTADAFQQSGGKFTSGIPLDLGTMREPARSSWHYGDWSRRDTYEQDAGVFLRKQLTLVERVFVAAGARYDWYKRTQENPTTGEEAHASDSAWSPSAGLSVAVIQRPEHKLNVFGNLGRGFSPVFRAVNNTQFADVKPETSKSVEAGLKSLLWGRTLELGATVYQIERNDIVAMNPVSRKQENVGDWRIRGVEADARYRPVQPVAFFAAYTVRNPIIVRFDADPVQRGKQVPVVSRHMLTIGMEARAPFGLGGGSSVRYASKFYGNEQNSFELPAYALWDLWLFYDIRTVARVSIFARNLLDADYYTAVFSGVKNGSAFAGPPRSFGAQLHAHF
jgi:iron complex outermembrane recepter protein